MIEIEKGVPMPADAGQGPSKYPWALMEIGDSFFVPNGDRVATVRQQAAKKGGQLGRKFTVSAKGQNGGVRVWRTE